VRVERGGRIRLRIINGASSSQFWIDLGELVGRVVATDGHPVHPVAGSRFPIAIAQRLDILIDLPRTGAFPILARLEGAGRQSGIVLATAGAQIPRIADNVQAAPPLDNSLETRLAAAEPLPARPADLVRTIDLDGGMKPYGWSMNGEYWTRTTPLMLSKGQRVEIDRPRPTSPPLTPARAPAREADADDPAEEWREIPGYEGYEASDLGRIRSVDRYLEFVGRWGLCVRFHRGRVLRVFNSNQSTGGTCLNLHLGKNCSIEVGRAVLLAFVGAPPSDDHEAAHRDSDGANNTPGNLIWATRAEISEFSRTNGSTPVGERNHGHAVSTSDVPVIIDRYARGESAHALAKAYGITRPAVSMIVSGSTWGHVPSPMREAAAEMAKARRLSGRFAGDTWPGESR
jgi:NUMOD4 motif/Multicopper oxidase